MSNGTEAPEKTGFRNDKGGKAEKEDFGKAELFQEGGVQQNRRTGKTDFGRERKE